jgi:hypothetical protein
MVAPTTAPAVADFMVALDTIHALAEAAPGFVWRLQTEAGNATDIRAFDDELLLGHTSASEPRLSTSRSAFGPVPGFARSERPCYPSPVKEGTDQSIIVFGGPSAARAGTEAGDHDRVCHQGR